MRKTLLAAAALALTGSAALAQGDATAPPAPLGPNTYRYQDEAPLPRAADDGIDASRRAADDQAARDDRREQRLDQAQAWQRRDLFCRSDAAARTDYEAREAARGEQARGSIGGTLGGAALGAIIGGAAGNAGTGAAIGAGAGLLAGSAIGADNARRAAADAGAAYGDAYRACMNTAQDDDGPGFDDDRGRAAYDYPPPPVYGRAYSSPYYYPYPRAYGPSFSFGFGFGPSYRGYYGPPPRAYGRPYRGPVRR